MKTFLFSLLLINVFTIHSTAQNAPTGKLIYNNDFKWTITIPAGFGTISAESWARYQSKGAEAIEKTIDGKVENQATTIFVFRKDQFNYFESNYQPFDISKDGNYLETCKEVNKILYKTFEAQMTGAKLDSSTSTTSVSGLTFQTFKLVTTFSNKMSMTLLMYNRLFGKREFTVNIMTIDKKMEEELLKSWLSSKFDK